MKKRGRIGPVEEYLSPDLCREILCRLPVKDLLRVRLVCKTWRSIIDDPLFASLHLTCYENNVKRSHLFVLEKRCNSYDTVIRRSDTFGEICVSDRPLFRPYEFPHIVGYINGLIVLWINRVDNSYPITVWNPSIRRHFVLPPLPWSSPHLWFSQYNIRVGFGYDPSTNDYKVVLVDQRDRYSSNFGPTTVYLYTFESGRWRVINSGHRFPFLSTKNAFIKGIIYWATRDDLFLFDVGKETFSHCNVPDYGSMVAEPFPVEKKKRNYSIYFR